MEVPSTDPKTWFAAIAAVLMTLLTWTAKRQVATADDHELRLKALETDRITKVDITAVYERINQLADQSHEQYSDLSSRMGNQHAQILQTIINQQASR